MFTALAITAALTAAAGIAPADTPIEPIEEFVITFMIETETADELCELTGQVFPLLAEVIGDPQRAADMLVASAVVTFEQGWNEDNAPGEPTGRMTLEAQEAWSGFLLDCMRHGA